MTNASDLEPEGMADRLRRYVIWGIAIGCILVVGVVVLLNVLARAVAQAPTLKCQNNLREIVFAARQWAEAQHTNQMPADFFSFTNQLAARSPPNVLRCPKDFTRKAAASWSELTGSNISYVFAEGVVFAGSTNEFVRCPLHNSAVVAEEYVLRGIPNSSERKR